MTTYEAIAEAHRRARAQRRETVADIVAAMCCWRPQIGERSVDVMRGFADRLDAAANVERAERSSATPANAAKMREALVKLKPLVEAVWESDGGEDVSAELAEMKDIIAAALATPPRNCDLYPTYDASYRKWYATQRVGGDYCEWLFAPAKESEAAEAARTFVEEGRVRE